MFSFLIPLFSLKGEEFPIFLLLQVRISCLFRRKQEKSLIFSTFTPKLVNNAKRVWICPGYQAFCFFCRIHQTFVVCTLFECIQTCFSLFTGLNFAQNDFKTLYHARIQCTSQNLTFLVRLGRYWLKSFWFSSRFYKI